MARLLLVPVVLVLLAVAATRAGAEVSAMQCYAQPTAARTDAGCSPATALLRANGVAMSPDGAHVYAVGTRSGALSVFDRDATGALTWRGCISDNGTDGVDGTGGRCLDGHALKGAKAVLVTPDGRHVYVAATRSGAVDTFAIGADGTPRQIGCMKESAIESTCDDGRGLGGARGLALSPDGRHLYVAAAASNAVTVLERDPGSGRLAMGSCVSDTGADGQCADGAALKGVSSVAVSADGKRVYATAYRSGAVVLLEARGAQLFPGRCFQARPPRGGACSALPTISGAYWVTTVGNDAYVAARHASAITQFRGADPFSCLSRTQRFGKECTEVPSIGGVSALAAVPGGTALVSGGGDGGVSLLARDGQTGQLSFDSCLQPRNVRGGCTPVTGLGNASHIAISPQGTQAIVALPDRHGLQVVGLGG